MIPYLDLKIQYKAMQKDILNRIHTVLDHGQFILGPEVAECEKALAEFVGTKYALTAASGTDAILMALMALGVQPGDEVVTTPFSFFATTEMISILGATPVFVDIERDTFNIDATKLHDAITPRTRAIMPVSLFGQCPDFDEINKVSGRYNIPVIEDAAQSFGATYRGERSCNLTLIGATSFFPAKPLGCYGDGGAVFTSSPEVYKKMQMIRNHGQESRYRHTMIGINGRLDTLQCAVIIEKLKRYAWEIEQRNRIAERYNFEFSSLGGRVQTPNVKTHRTSVWAQYSLLVPKRDEFAKKLAELGVPTSVHYPTALHQQPVYESLRGKYHLPIAEECAAKIISLPLYADMPEEHQDVVIQAVKRVVQTI